MDVRIDETKMHCEDVAQVARHGAKLHIDEACLSEVDRCRTMLEEHLAAGDVMYGINTGIGELADVTLDPSQIKEFQRKLVYSHAAGQGDPASFEASRAAWTTRIKVLSHGHSGVRREVVALMRDILNSGMAPVMCVRGSVGACGDLSPMAQMALTLIGEGDVYLEEGKIVPAMEALSTKGLSSIEFEARDGLAAINGSNVITGMGALQVVDVDNWIKTADIAASMTMDALLVNMISFDRRLHEIRGHVGSVTCARNILRVTEGSEILAQKNKKVQDAYSLRSTPQVQGPARDVLAYARNAIETELNGVADNPVFFPDEEDVFYIPGANFQGTPMAFGLEFLGTAVATVAALSERRLNRLLNPNLSRGLPAFLTRNAGMNSGMMLTQYTAGALVCESRVLTTPACHGSIPAAADQEDFVSMGLTTALKTRQIIDHASAVLGIELLNAAQALEFRKPLKPGKGVAAAMAIIREHCEMLDEDKPLYNDINTMARLVSEGVILRAVEEAIGTLE
ncbi:MAG: aromatic amino acid lyase [Deltaproteobacteria bacterium]|nr:aromatic amino acid lyase [Deltaproteobacteria bacterium]